MRHLHVNGTLRRAAQCTEGHRCSEGGGGFSWVDKTKLIDLVHLCPRAGSSGPLRCDASLHTQWTRTAHITNSTEQSKRNSLWSWERSLPVRRLRQDKTSTGMRKGVVWDEVVVNRAGRREPGQDMTSFPPACRLGTVPNYQPFWAVY